MERILLAVLSLIALVVAQSSCPTVTITAPPIISTVTATSYKTITTHGIVYSIVQGPFYPETVYLTCYVYSDATLCPTPARPSAAAIETFTSSSSFTPTTTASTSIFTNDISYSTEEPSPTETPSAELSLSTTGSSLNDVSSIGFFSSTEAPSSGEISSSVDVSSTSTDASSQVLPATEIPTTLSSSSLIEFISSSSPGLLSSTTTDSSSLSATTTSSTPSASSSSPAAPTSILRGVNVGGWLVLEKWMNSDVFNGTTAVDEWTFDQTTGASNILQQHWQTYFTEADVKLIASWGFNALRIPIGWWAYDNAGVPYIQGADAYLQQALQWARNSNMKVWIDLHGAPGSQNGFQNSGHSGAVYWQKSNNLPRTISVLTTIAQKYGTLAYSDVVGGIELVNEPISRSPNNFTITQQWAQQAYTTVRNAAQNKNLRIIMHDAFMGPDSWLGIHEALNVMPQSGSGNLIDSAGFAIDTHIYQVFQTSDQNLTQAQHIAAACFQITNLTNCRTAGLPVYAGEWSAVTNICTDAQGNTSGGTSCSTKGCQCESSTSSTMWNAFMLQAIRQYVEAQLDAFEAMTSGYFMWSYKGPGAWSLSNGISLGIVPNPITSRKYPGQCVGY